MNLTAVNAVPVIEPRRLLIFGLASLALHLVVIIGLVVSPDFSVPRENLGPVYTVELVGDLEPPPPPENTGPKEIAPEPPKATKPSPPTKGGVEEKPATKAPAPKPAELIALGKPDKQTPKPAETLTKMGAPKPSSKRLVLDSEKELAAALAETRRKLEAKQKTAEAEAQKQAAEERHLAQAMSRVRRSVADKVYGTGGASSSGTKASSALARYYGQVWYRIRSNWTLPQEWRTGKLGAVVVMVIQPDGHIADYRFEKKSGNARFDQSVAWAVERSNPLPPLPQSVASSNLEIGVKFNPED